MSNAELRPAPLDRDRPAMRPDDATFSLERQEVLADGLLGDVEPLGELGDEDAAVLLDQTVDLLLSFPSEHRSLTARRPAVRDRSYRAEAALVAERLDSGLTLPPERT